MEKLITIREVEQLEELRQYIKDNDFIAFDSETTGVLHGSKIIGFSFSAHVDIGYYVILSYWDVEKQELIDLPIKKEAESIVKLLVGKNLIMHNAVFDCYMVNTNYAVDLMPYVHTDTMILAHLLDENRQNGLKELGVSIFGESAREEQLAMKDSVHRNGGKLTKDLYELYKADADLMARYGAKDTILTIKLFYHLVPQLYEESLDQFFYKDESMPLLRGPTYDLNTTGLKVDIKKLQDLKGALEASIMEAKTFVHKEISRHVKDKYPGTSKTKIFNIGSGSQISWLLFDKLSNEFVVLTKGGKELCKDLNIRIPYTGKAKREFIATIKSMKGRTYSEAKFNPKTKKMQRPKKVKDYWTYLSSDKNSLGKFANKYKWIERLLYLTKEETILDTYVLGIQKRLQYGIIRPSFLQHGTTSGRYSSKNPNFQNLPRDDKRVKATIIARPGKIFIGADYAQLEPRVFASMSQDERLMSSFAKGEDFYSVIGMDIFDKKDVSKIKSDENSFAKKYPELRDRSKVVALATPYGRTASFTASQMGIKQDEAQELMDKYFEEYGKVELMMLESHEMAKRDGRTLNLFGRPRRIPEAKNIEKRYGKSMHGELPYEIRTLLNLAMNHRIQSTGASIMNRAAIAVHKMCSDIAVNDHRWAEVKIVMQIHDELILEAPEAIAEDVLLVLKEGMENTVKLPGVNLLAEPKIANNIAGLK